MVCPFRTIKVAFVPSGNTISALKYTLFLPRKGNFVRCAHEKLHVYSNISPEIVHFSFHQIPAYVLLQIRGSFMLRGKGRGKYVIVGFFVLIYRVYVLKPQRVHYTLSAVWLSSRKNAFRNCTARRGLLRKEKSSP